MSDQDELAAQLKAKEREAKVLAKKLKRCEFMYERLEEQKDHFDKTYQVVIAQTEEQTRQLNVQNIELQQAREIADESVKAKALFLANMSHEIRTPMNAILGFLAITLESDLNETQKEHLSTAHNSANNLLKIINDILDFSKMESTDIDLEEIPFDLHRLLNDTVSTLGFKAIEKGLEIKLDINENVSKVLLGDPTRLGQVIINLTGNSIKFTDSGSVTIRVKQASAEEGEDKLMFTISDTGIGMTQAQVDGVFEAFSQADASTVRKYGGTGLGTTISKQIVECMQGRIWADSEVGVGSNFHFTARLAPTDQEPVSTNETVILEGKRRRFKLILAEDIAENATLATLRLEQHGHSVAWARDGQEAVDLYLEGDYDLILMDVQMPVLDGLAASRKVRELEAESGKAISIIALTANIMSGDRETCLEAGMDNVAGKPIDFPALFNMMETTVPEDRGSEYIEEGEEEDSGPAEQIDFSPAQSVIDVNKGIAIWGEALSFVQSLLSFSRSRMGDAEKLQAELEAGDYDAAKHTSHALKGLAGNMAIVHVASICTELDERLVKDQHDPALPELNRQLILALQDACAHINLLQLPDTGNTVEKLDFDHEQVTRLFTVLHENLNSLDPDPALEVLDELSAYIDDSELQGIRDHIDGFDFDAAEELAAKLQENATP